MCPGAVRASSIFPILSVILLFMGGLCIAASEFYKSRHNIILSSGILFVSAGTQEEARKGESKNILLQGAPYRAPRLLSGHRSLSKKLFVVKTRKKGKSGETTKSQVCHLVCHTIISKKSGFKLFVLEMSFSHMKQLILAPTWADKIN